MNIPVDSNTSLSLFERTQTVELFHLVSFNREHLKNWERWIINMTTLAATQYFIDQNKRLFEELSNPENQKGNHPGFQLGVVHDQKIIGLVGFQGLHLTDRVCALGYWIDQRWEGKGFVTHSCEALIDYAFSELEMNRIEIQCAVENERSQKVAERLGFKREARLSEVEFCDGKYIDHYLFRLLRREWGSKSESDFISSQLHH